MGLSPSISSKGQAGRVAHLNCQPSKGDQWAAGLPRLILATVLQPERRFGGIRAAKKRLLSLVPVAAFEPANG